MELARYLVLNGASTNLKIALGDTPESLAKRCGHHDLALLLSAHSPYSHFPSLRGTRHFQGLSGSIGVKQRHICASMNLR